MQTLVHVIMPDTLSTGTLETSPLFSKEDKHQIWLVTIHSSQEQGREKKEKREVSEEYNWEEKMRALRLGPIWTV